MSINNGRLIDQLDAVNTVLTAVGRAPVNSLDNSLNRELQFVLAALRRADISLQSEGWSWNTSFVSLAPDIDGRIYLPRTTMYWALPQAAPPGVPLFSLYGEDLSQVSDASGQPYLIRTGNPTAPFTTPVSLLITAHQEWETLPVAARQWIVASAALARNAASLNDARVQRFEDETASRARVVLEQTEDDFIRRNQITGSPYVMNLLGRRGRSGSRRGRY